MLLISTWSYVIKYPLKLVKHTVGSIARWYADRNSEYLFIEDHHIGSILRKIMFSIIRVPSISWKQNSLIFLWFLSDEFSKFYDAVNISATPFWLFSVDGIGEIHRSHEAIDKNGGISTPKSYHSQSLLTMNMAFGYDKFPAFSPTGKLENSFSRFCRVRRWNNVKQTCLLNPHSAGIDFRLQYLTSIDVRFWRLKSIPAL